MAAISSSSLTSIGIWIYKILEEIEIDYSLKPSETKKIIKKKNKWTPKLYRTEKNPRLLNPKIEISKRKEKKNQK